MNPKAPPPRPYDESPSISKEPIVTRELPGMVTVPDLAKQLEISTQTAHLWVRQGKLLAWDQAGDLKGPVDQILRPKEPLPALAEVAAVVGDPELTWDFLSNPWRWSGPPEAPIEKHRRGEVQEVLNAAPAYLNSMG